MIKQKHIFLYSCFLVLLFNSLLYAQKKDNCEVKSEEFMFVFSNPNSLKDTGGIEEITMTARLYVQGTAGSKIEIGTKKYEIPSSGFLVIEDSFPYVPYEYSDKNVIRILANSSVSIVAERVSQFSTHRFPLIPVSRWGKVYSIPSYPDQSKVYKVNNFIDIIAQDKKTNVLIKDSKGKSIQKITLNAGQNYEFNGIDDFSGYSVEANKNIGVISGNHCLRITAACDHIALMLPDDSQLGNKYYNPGTSFFSKTTIHCIIASKNNTKIKINGNTVAILNKGEFYDYRKENPHVIESSSPVMVYSIFDKSSQSSPEYSVDPSAILIPSVENAIQDVLFSFPEFMTYSKDIQMVMKTNKTNSLTLDGTDIPDISWVPFSYDPSVSSAVLHFSDEKVHRLSVKEPDAFFIPIMMGRGWDVSVGTALKPGFTNLLTGENPPCPVNIPPNDALHPAKIIPKEVFLTDFTKPILVEKEEIEIFVFDNAEEDGDIISLYLNDKLIYPDVRVLKAGVWLKFTLEKGENIIRIKAENEGDIYPNTAGLTFDDDITRQTIILHNKKGQSKSLKIISR